MRLSSYYYNIEVSLSEILYAIIIDQSRRN